MAKDEKTCDYPGCIAAVYATVRDLDTDRSESLCLAHYKLISKHFAWYRESGTLRHPTH